MILNKNRKNKKSQSISNIILKASIPIFLIFGLIIFMMFNNINEVRQLAYRYMNDTAQLNVNRINDDINKINSEIIYLLNKDVNINQLPSKISPQDVIYYELIDDIRSLNASLRHRYGGGYYFYQYSASSEFMIFDKNVFFKSSMKTDEAKKLEEMIHKYLSGKIPRKEWNFFSCEDDIYLFSFYEKDGIGVGCVSKLDDFFAEFNLTNLGYNGIPYFETKNGEILISATQNQHNLINEYISNNHNKQMFLNDVVSYSYPIGRMGNLNLLITSEDDILDRIMLLQISSIVIASIILLLVFIMVYNYHYRVLKPMRLFVESLHHPEQEKWLHEADDNGILELELANEEFKELMKQIKTLKIAVYERQLFEKKIELEFVQELVKPHFYLNCLSIIHGKAELINAKDIADIAAQLSNYMRYILNHSYELRPIKDELRHISDYINIQKIRYGDRFDFDVSIDEGIGEYLMPPLLIQTFVENSIKHAMNFEEHIQISVYITMEINKESSYIYISVADTGKGFSKEILEKINNNESIFYDERQHIGIQNTKRRLSLLFEEEAFINVSNMSSDSGAIVEIQFPAIDLIKKNK